MLIQSKWKPLTTHQTTSIDGAILEGHGNGVTVDTTHEQTEKGAHCQELVESGAIDGCNLEETKDDHVEDHGPLATKLVTSQTEEGSADRSEKQCQCDGGGDGCVASFEVCRELGGLDREGVEVERIGSPGEEADKEVEPVLETQLREQADGVLERLRLLPLAGLLTIFVPDNHTLVPLEEVAPSLLRSCECALGQRVGGSVASDARHCVEWA